MGYAESLAALVRSAKVHGAPVSLEKPGDDERDILITVFGGALAEAIETAGYPGGIEIPLSTEELYLYPLAELEQRQAGYRTDARTGQASSGWDENRYVIADWAGNPVSIGRDGGLAWSLHGQGAWGYFPVASNLGAFLIALAHWLDYYRGERSGRILDENFEVAPEVAGDVLRQMAGDLSEAEAQNLTDFLLGTVSR